MGWKPVGFSEIEKFPSQVLAHHYPTVTNFGDMTKYKEWNFNDSIGLLVGGTPCQSFSVAGLRKGLDDPRGNLALTYVGILDKFRPKWCVWENVPGVLSSGGGRDFGSFLGALGEIGYGWAYRVLDAQYFGVAQRRKRVFVVGHLGDWKPPAEILFESESLSGNIKQGRTKGKDIANCLTKSPSSYSSYNPARGEGNAVVTHCVNTFPTLLSSTAGVSRPGNAVTEHQTYIAFGWQNSASQGMSVDTISPTLDTSKTPATMQNMAVRRLTPVECERLQGFPDNYTNIPKSADGNRYKALGNSMAVPVMRWIGERINQYEQRGVEKHL
jgi:DNA (cytosine-5)-methyltransferase 1